MNLIKLFETQKVLDARIEKEHPKVEGEDRLAKKILALQVELGELANEWRGFKFWSNDQEPRVYDANPKDQCQSCKGSGYLETHKDFIEWIFCKECDGVGCHFHNPLLEEYVDCLHFILSIGLEFPINFKGLEKYSVYDTYPNRNETFIFNKLFGIINSILLEDESEALGYYYSSFQWLLELGCKLGFTWEQIEQAYYEKNEVNHERQNTGY